MKLHHTTCMYTRLGNGVKSISTLINAMSYYKVTYTILVTGSLSLLLPQTPLHIHTHAVDINGDMAANMDQKTEILWLH